jgi:glycosyltransferase 2 family protein
MLVGLALFIVYIIFGVRLEQVTQFLQQLNSLQFTIFYILALAAVLASVFFWSAAWNTILRTLSVEVSYRRAYLYYWVGYFTDLVIPCATVCGELTRMYLVEQQTKKSYGVLAASAITNRIVAYTIVTIGLYTGAILIFLKPSTPPVLSNVFFLFVVGVTAYTVVLLYLAFVKQAAKNLTLVYQKIMKRLRPKTYQASTQQTSQSLASYYQGFTVFRHNPRRLIKPFILNLTSYLLGLAVYILIFYAVGISAPSPEFYIVIYFIATAFQDIAAVLSVGSLDIVLASVLISYGLNPGVSIITALLLRSVGFWFPLFVGFASVELLGARELVSKSPHLLRKHSEEKNETITLSLGPTEDGQSLCISQ